MNLPKHVQEKINSLAKSENASMENISKLAITLGYTLAMEQMKPILDEARELVNWPSMTREYQSREVTYSVKKLSKLLKQYDNDSE